MAIQFLNSIDLNRNQLIRAVVHSDSSDPAVGNEVAGQLFYNTGGTGSLKFYNGSGDWITLSTQTYTLPTAANGTKGGVQIGYTQNAKNYPVQLSSEKMFVNVPWTDSHSLTQVEVEDIVGAMLDGTETLISVSYDADNNNLDFVVDNDLANYDNSTSGFITSKLTTEEVQDIVGGMFSSNTETRISATYSDGGDGVGKINLAVDDMNYSLPAADATNRGGVELGSDTTLTQSYATGVSGESDRTYPVQVNSAGQMGVSVPWSQRAATSEGDIKAILSALDASDDLYIGDSGNDCDVIIRGNLSVTGTTTTINTTNLEITDKLIVVGKDAGTLSDTDGAGLKFGANASAPTITWDNSNTRLTANKVLAATSFVGNVTGKADTAGALHAAVNIGGVSFDGSAAINLPGVNAAGNQSTSGNAATATTAGTVTTAAQTNITSVGTLTGLTVTNTIAGSINGNAATATKFAATKTIAGQAFDGSANITIASTDLSNTSNIVLKDATQTLTGKSIVATQLTGTVDAARLPALTSGFVLNITTSGVEGNSEEASGSTVYTVTHGFSSRGITARLYETASPYQEVFTEVKYPEDEKVTFTFGTAPTAGAYTAVIHTN